MKFTTLLPALIAITNAEQPYGPCESANITAKVYSESECDRDNYLEEAS